MLYLLAVIFPPAVFFQLNRHNEGMINLVLWMSCCLSPIASGWAAFTLFQHFEDERANMIVDAIEGKSRRRPTQSKRRPAPVDDDENDSDSDHGYGPARL